MIRLAWDGEVLSIGLDGVSRPRIFGFFDWEAIGVYYRAIMMSIRCRAAMVGRAQERRRDGSSEANRPNLHSPRAGSAAAERTLRDRARIGPLKDGARDLHWGNLTAPKFSILDWETWGQAPFGFDVAQLHLMTLSQPETLEKIHQVFPAVVAKPEYDVALLYIIGEEMQRFDEYGHAPALQAYLRQEAERVPTARRFATFC